MLTIKWSSTYVMWKQIIGCDENCHADAAILHICSRGCGGWKRQHDSAGPASGFTMVVIFSECFKSHPCACGQSLCKFTWIIDVFMLAIDWFSS